MNINELIVEFLDGTSTPDMDKSLFENLAVNEVSQQKFKKLVEIENSFNSSKSYFQPSAESVNQVFTKLGFKKTGMFSSFSLFQTNFVKFSLPSIVGTLLLVFGYNYFDGNDKDEIKYNKSYFTIGNLPELKNEFVYSSFNNNSNNNAFIKNEINPNVVESKYFGLDENKELIEFSSKDELVSFYSNEVQDELILNENISKIDKSNYINTSLNKKEFKPVKKLSSISYYDKLESNQTEDLPFSFSITLSPTIDFSQSNIQPEELSRFNNLGANILYKFNEKFSLGLEIQQETYLQSFSEFDNFDREIIYTQRPNFTNFGIAVDYNLLDKINLYTALGTNTNFSGGYSRIRLAREFSGLFPVDFLFGLEYSTLYFNFKSELYNSNKFGIYFGAKL